ncbi:amidase family protein [Streptomyces sp. NBC_00882]|uniref:amidase family protein n=1 Tax=Streptomyces sp. NBC_00882 TaxID=2975856 RepID=UPI00386BB558
MLAGDPAVLEAARDADAQRASGADLGPLHGLPITLKDSYETAGLRTVCGRTDLKDHVPDQDAEAVRRLRSAGAVIIGKTNMPAGNQDVQAGNPMFGPTLNPWNTARTSGGSAGGGAVAAAAGLTALDFGSPAKSASRAAHHCENTCMPPSASHRSPTGAPSAAPCPRHTTQLRLRQRPDEAPSGCPHPRPAAASRHASDSSARMRSKDR